MLDPNSETSAIHVWLVLFRAAHAIEQNATLSVLGLGLGIAEFGALEVLLHKGPLPVNVIGKKILLTSGSITAAIDRLESRKLVHRTADPQDRRARIVHLTETGKRLIKDGLQRHAIDMEETLAVLRPVERAELVRLLKKAGLWAAARLEDREHRDKR